MTPEARTYADLYTMNYRAVRALCRDVSEDEARRRPDGRQNPMLWITGHITTYRGELVKILGGDPGEAAPMRSTFGKDVRSDENAWPALSAVVAALTAAHERLVERITTLGAAAFDSMVDTPAGSRLPALLFLHFHESYHVGQLGYVRTWLGKSPLVTPGSHAPKPERS